jgi:hypothetical protein
MNKPLPQCDRGSCRLAPRHETEHHPHDAPTLSSSAIVDLVGWVEERNPKLTSLSVYYGFGE